MRKRFWTDVQVASSDNLFAPQLDGRPIRLPGGSYLAVKSHALAVAIAEEWRKVEVGAAFSSDDLPFTRMAGTMIERILPDRSGVRATLLRYGLDDGLCYRPAGELHSDIEQVFRWLAEKEIYPIVTSGLMPVEQPDRFRQALEALLDRQDLCSLTALGVLVPAMGSLLLGLCLVEEGIPTSRAANIACMDERRQLSVWGKDAELLAAIDQRQTEVHSAMTYLTLCRQP